jgi:flagellar motor switch protein FliM
MAQKDQVNQDALAAEWGLAPNAGQAVPGADKNTDTAADAATDAGAGAGAGASASASASASAGAGAGGVAGDQTAVQWAAMLDENANPLQSGKGGAERILNQEEIDGLLGFSLSDVALNNNSGIRAIIDSAMVSYERLPMLEIVFDRLVRLMTTSLRNFTSDNVEVSLDRITSVRFGDYLNSIPLPAILAVFKAEEWENFGLVTVNSSLIYSIIDVLLGGRRGQTAIRVEGRPYTSIESNLVKRMIEVVLADAEIAFKPLSPVKFNIDRMETNPRFAAISRPANAAILVRLRVDMEDRGGDFELLLPYATIEPIRGVLLQMFMGEKFGRDPIWEGHLATEIGQAEIAVDAVLYEARLPLKQMMKLEVGDTLMLEMKPDAAVSVRCGNVTLSEGHMGRVGDRVAVRVTKSLRRPRTTFAMFEKADQSTTRMELP